MRKSRWIEWVEWCAFAVVLLFVIGLLAKRDEITSGEPENPLAPVQELAE